MPRCLKVSKLCTFTVHPIFLEIVYVVFMLGFVCVFVCVCVCVREKNWQGYLREDRETG